MSTQTDPIILSVSQLTQAIKFKLESTFPLVWVKGEVSNFKQQSSGHLYFSLKDQEAQVACAFFRGEAMKLALLPKDGDQVLVKAELNVWPPKGGYQLIVRELTHTGKGELLIKLELLKKKLKEKGYFDPKQKRPLPKSPKRIGIITSPTGAVLQDMKNVLSRRMAGYHVIVNPVKVQGDGADKEIARAIVEMNRYKLCDVLVVCRGGGSFEDLMPFNSEIVADAIYKSAIPVVSAVGHETDVTIADFVADLRAPTPSAAAEIISHEQLELIDRLQRFKTHLDQHLFGAYERKKRDMQKIKNDPFFLSSTKVLAPFFLKLDTFQERLDKDIYRLLDHQRKELMQIARACRLLRPSRKIHENRVKTDEFEKRIDESMQRLLHEKAKNLQQLKKHLESIHPNKLLAKGFSIAFHKKTHTVVRSVSELQPQDRIEVQLLDGSIEAVVESINESLKKP